MKLISGDSKLIFHLCEELPLSVFYQLRGWQSYYIHNSLYMLHYASVVHRFSAGFLFEKEFVIYVFWQPKRWQEIEQNRKKSVSQTEIKIKAGFLDYQCIGFVWECLDLTF